MKKLILVFVLILSMTTLVFAGGGKEKEDVEGPVTLDMWFQDWTAGLEITREFADYVKGKHPNVGINVIPIPRESMTEKTVPAIMSGTEPDIIFGYTLYLEGIDYSQLFYPVTPEFFSKQEAENNWYKNFLKIMQGSDGNYYGIPWGSGSDGWGFVMNNQLADQAGVDYTPGLTRFETWEDVVDAAKAMTEYGPDGNIDVSGLSLGTTQELWPLFECFALSLGDELWNKNTKKWNYSGPGAKKALQLLYYDLVERHKVFDPGIGDSYSAFPKNIIGMANFGPWALGAFRADYPDLDTTYFVAPMPSDDPQFVLTAWAFFFFSKQLEERGKAGAAKIVAQELATPAYPKIQIEKWAGTVANKDFLEGIKDGSIVPQTELGKVNADIAVELAETHAPYLYFFEGTSITTEERNLIVTPELEALFSGMQGIDETLDNITLKLNKAEQE